MREFKAAALLACRSRPSEDLWPREGNYGIHNARGWPHPLSGGAPHVGQRNDRGVLGFRASSIPYENSAISNGFLGPGQALLGVGRKKDGVGDAHRDHCDEPRGGMDQRPPEPLERRLL